MGKYIFVLLMVFHSEAFSQWNKFFSEVNKVLNTNTALTSEEISKGLKEALVNGVVTGTDLSSKVDGFFKNPEIKIPFPADVKKMEDKLRALGFGAEVDKFVLTLNRAAEDAAKDAKPIFISAIKQLTINDALAILNGQPDAATQYLKKTTFASLKDKFKPTIQASLQKVNATKYYTQLATIYNKIPFVNKVNPNLDEYSTEMTINGLFILIAKEEKNIRQDPLARTTNLLKKVFGSTSNKS